MYIFLRLIFLLEEYGPKEERFCSEGLFAKNLRNIFEKNRKNDRKVRSISALPPFPASSYDSGISQQIYMYIYIYIYIYIYT